MKVVCGKDGAENLGNGVRGLAVRGGGCALIAVQGGRWGAIFPLLVLRFLVLRQWWLLLWWSALYDDLVLIR